MADDPRTLPLRVLHVIRSAGLWSPGDGLRVCVSGGCDSTVLLHILAKTAGAHGAKMEVWSFDHGLRPESAAEVALVGAQAAALGLQFRGVELGLAPGPDLAARARQARKRALADDDRLLATGHHADDQAETVLQRLMRGSGARGLSAMRVSDGLSRRPLLQESRATIRAWAQAEGLRWVEDPSNGSSERGRLRAWMPALTALRAGAARGLARSAALLAEDEALLHILAQEALPRCRRDGGLDLQALRALPVPLASRLLLDLAEGASAPIVTQELRRLLQPGFSGSGRIELGRGARLEVQAGVVRLAQST